MNGGSGIGSQGPAVVHFGLPLGPDHRYVVTVRFIGRNNKPGPVIERERRARGAGAYQVLEVKGCERRR